MRKWFTMIAVATVIFQNLAASAICNNFYFLEGFHCVDPDAIDIIILSTITLSVSFFLPIYDSAETAAIWFVYICHLVSVSVAIPLLAVSRLESYEYYVLCAGLFVIGAKLVPLITFDIRPPRLSPMAVPVGTLIVSGLVLLVLLTSFSVSFVLPSITDVYGVRSEYKDTLEDASNGLLGYIPILSGYFFAVICIFISGYYWLRRNFLFAAISLALAILHSTAVFSLTAFKSVAFLFIVVLMLLIGLRNRKHPLLVFLLGMLGCAILAAVIAHLGIDQNAFYQWVRRTMVTSGKNAVYHLELFGLGNRKIYSNAPQLVSLAFYGTNGSANTGMFGSGLGVAGLFGVVLHTAVFFVFLVVLRNAARHVPPYVAICLSVPAAYAFVNSSPTTVLVTYGGLLMAIYLWFWGAHLHALQAQETTSPAGLAR